MKTISDEAVAWLPVSGVYLIRYDDTDQADELIALGDNARDVALTRFREVSISWNAHLFVKIASNYPGCAPNATPPDTVDAISAENACPRAALALPDQPDDRILWGVVANAGAGSNRRAPRWAHVRSATGIGSTSSSALCKRFGFDPDEVVGREA